VRWYAAFVPLGAALVAMVIAGIVVTTRGTNTWCANNSFACSLHTNVIGVVAIGGTTTYWYYGFRRSRLLARYRRELRAQLTRSAASGMPVSEDLEAVRRRSPSVRSARGLRRTCWTPRARSSASSCWASTRTTISSTPCGGAFCAANELSS
jgi:hypothetical protein